LEAARAVRGSAAPSGGKRRATGVALTIAVLVSARSPTFDKISSSSSMLR